MAQHIASSVGRGSGLTDELRLKPAAAPKGTVASISLPSTSEGEVTVTVTAAKTTLRAIRDLFAPRGPARSAASAVGNHDTAMELGDAQSESSVSECSIDPGAEEIHLTIDAMLSSCDDRTNPPVRLHPLRGSKILTHTVEFPDIDVAKDFCRIVNESLVKLDLFGLAHIAPISPSAGLLLLRPFVRRNAPFGGPRGTAQFARAATWSADSWPIKVLVRLASLLGSGGSAKTANPF